MRAEFNHAWGERPRRRAASRAHVYAYGAHIPHEMFALVIFRCPSYGTTGKAGSWCKGHSAPPGCVGQSLRIRREPVLVPHADPEHPVTELYDRE